MTDWNPNPNPPYNPNTGTPAVSAAPVSPGVSTPVTTSQSWQDEARAAGWQAPEENSGFQQSTPTTNPPQTTPVDIGAGSSPMTVPLTNETRSGQEPANLAWDKAKVNEANGLPDEMSLSDVFSKIRLHPTEVASLLAQWAGQHHGGPNQNLSNKLNTEAAKVADPATYKND